MRNVFFFLQEFHENRSCQFVVLLPQFYSGIVGNLLEGCPQNCRSDTFYCNHLKYCTISSTCVCVCVFESCCQHVLGEKILLMHSYQADMSHKDDGGDKYHNTRVSLFPVSVSKSQNQTEERFLSGKPEGSSSERSSAMQRAAAWIVSTLKRSKNGKCLQCRGCVLYERAYTRRAGSVSSQALPRLICFHFSPPAWRMVPADRCLRSRRFSVITRSVLFSPPHGVHLPAVDLGNGENESQVLGLSWNNFSF